METKDDHGRTVLAKVLMGTSKTQILVDGKVIAAGYWSDIRCSHEVVEMFVGDAELIDLWQALEAACGGGG